jgi:C1A family cysteine protease
MLERLPPVQQRPETVDWRSFFPPVEDQLDLACGAAHACLALVCYFERRASGRPFDPSPMFVYNASRRLLGRSGNVETPLRTTAQAIVRFGVPSQRHWPYEPDLIDRQPDAFVYGAARDLHSLSYVRLDGRTQTPQNALRQVKSFLAAGFPSVFGFTVCSTLSSNALVPYPTVFDSAQGGQAAVAVGYDDHRRVRSEKGALLVRISWGEDWGKKGYGWLPYRYVREQLAADFWTFLRPEWLDSGEFERPT